MAITLRDVKEKFRLCKHQLDARISEKNLQDAKKVICDHKILGPELGLTETEMSDIGQEPDPKLQRSATLEKWKQKYAWTATYAILIEALLKCHRADVVENMCEQLAQDISTKECVVCSGSTASPPTSPLNHATITDGNEDGGHLGKSPSDSPPAHEKEQPPSDFVEDPVITYPTIHEVEEEEVMRLLRGEVKRMKNIFQELCDATSEDLEKRKVPVWKIKRSLCIRRASDTQTNIDLVAGHQHEIQEADTVHDLFGVAGNCWDFLNPALLKRIIDNHCSESQGIQHQKKKYLEQLLKFRKKTLARQFAKVHKTSNYESKVIFEMGNDWDTATLEDVENLKQKIREQGHFNDHTFNCKRPKNSSLSLVWGSPCGCPISTTILHIPPSFYLEHGIRRVLVKGVCVVDVKFEEEQKEVAAKQEESLRKTIQVMASDEEAEKLKEELENTREKNKKLSAALQEAKKERKDLEDKLGKSGPLLQATRQENTFKEKGPQVDTEEAKINLTKEVELSKKLSEKHEVKERELLKVLKIMKEVEERKLTPPTGGHFVESRGIRYNMELGGANGDTKEMMILLSVGKEFPANVQVEQREEDPVLAERVIQTHGQLPPIVTGLRKTAAADLMATVSVRLQTSNADLVRLCLDVPGKQRSKEYYLKAIEEFFKQCQEPLAVLIYLGHSEKGTGNWCFKDGTISFQTIFHLYRNHRCGKRLNIQTDCCYSGNWVKECARTLDRLNIPPCGHRAREQEILLKVYASCQPNQRASEPCYSVKGVTVHEDGTLEHCTWKESSNTQTFFGTDFTKLTCCRGPEEPCQSEEALGNWTWEDAVNDGLKSNVFTVRGKVRGQSAWYFVLLSDTSEENKKEFLEQVKAGNIDVNMWGHIIKSGWGKDPPEKYKSWMSV